MNDLTEQERNVLKDFIGENWNLFKKTLRQQGLDESDGDLICEKLEQ